MTKDGNKELFLAKMRQGTQNLLSSSKELFEPPSLNAAQASIARFGNTLEDPMERAPQCSRELENILDHSRESVRQFIKAASQLFGTISITLESV
jgi:hypothetical protein